MVSRAEGEDTFDALTDRPVSEEGPVSRIRLKHSPSPAQLDNTVREQIASIPALVENAVMRFFGNAGKVTESSPNTKVIPVIKTVVSGALAKDLRSAAACFAVEDAVHKWAQEPPSVDTVAAKLIDALSSTVPVVRFVKKEVEKNVLDRAKMEESFVRLAGAVE